MAHPNLQVSGSPALEGRLASLRETKYRKQRLPLMSPVHNFVRGFRWAYKRRGLYPRGFITGIKKNRFETSLV